jgi:hypothetical protein
MRTYKYHHALVPEQLRYAGMSTTVRTVEHYHGGDVIYTLEGTERFAWLEPCLRDASATPESTINHSPRPHLARQTASRFAPGAVLRGRGLSCYGVNAKTVPQHSPF